RVKRSLSLILSATGHRFRSMPSRPIAKRIQRIWGPATQPRPAGAAFDSSLGVCLVTAAFVRIKKTMWQTRTPRNLAPLAALTLALAAAGCSSTPPGLSEGVNGAFIRAAATWDLNHDGDVTCEEWRQYAASVFRDADLNRDGKLTSEEFQRLSKIDRLFETANFAYYHVNPPGYVTQQEFLDRPNPAFAGPHKKNFCVFKAHQLRGAIFADPKRTNPGPPSTPGGR